MSDAFLQVALAVVTLALSGVGAVLAALVRRSVGAQDDKLDTIGRKVDGIAEKVGEHAEKLAAGAAEMQNLRRDHEKVEKALRDLEKHGCARAPSCTPLPR